MTVSPRVFAAIVGALIALAGVIALSLPITATVDDSILFSTAGIDCGSALVDDTSAMGGAPLAECRDSIGARRAWAWPLAAVGLIVVAAAMFVHPVRRSADTEQ